MSVETLEWIEMSEALADEGLKPLTPEARKRPDFIGGAKVRLADGQDWTLPKPRVRYAYSDGETGMRPILSGIGDGYADLIDRAEAAERALLNGTEQDDRGLLMFELVRAELAVARALFLRNYEATTEELSRLIQFGYDPEDAEGKDLRMAIQEVAYGRGPKPPAGLPD